MAWDEGQTLAARFEHACQVAAADHPHWRLGSSYSGFAAALVRHTPAAAAAVTGRLRRRMRLVAGDHWRRCRWVAFAVDGTRIEAPHTAANEAGLGRAGRDECAPQVALTAAWHMGTGLPWAYRVGPGTDGERAHLKRMAAEMPPGSLVVADAGFVGDAVCLRLLRAGRHFLLRVGGNVTLLERLGYHREERDGLVYLWPRKHRSYRPLVLRLIVLKQGVQDVYLVTDVLDPEALRDSEAAQLFAMRWGEEVFFRSYKQTLQRRTLRGRTAATCLAEAQWTLLGLWLLGLMTVTRLVSAGVDPLVMSVAKAREVVRAAMRGARPRRGPQTVAAGLGAARKDGYRRAGSKAARNYPRKKRQKPPGPPKLKTATAAEVKRAQKLPPPELPLRWTA